MPSLSTFLLAAQWAGILTIAFALLTLLSFLLSWGIRFRLVGATGFMLVLTAGLFALSLVPISRTVVPGAVRFARVYDSGATQVVIAVPSSITPPELAATLQQAASDLFSSGRLSQGEAQMTIRVRTLLHPEAGLSKLVYLGEIRRSLLVRDDPDMQITLYPEAVAQLPPAVSPQAEESE
ncbi:MAG: DUF2518 family protein [Leptolyngbyaceae cyanobacterium SL_7_1]|nr:DUF2518 family protein [Leptolyngbyaceae cyanobacterium SL_7_1]